MCRISKIWYLKTSFSGINQKLVHNLRNSNQTNLFEKMKDQGVEIASTMNLKIEGEMVLEATY